MFQPVVPLTGYVGWKFLQTTYDRQFEAFTDSASISRDRDYLTEKLSSSMPLEDFLSDKRLLRISMTAFDLGGEEWKVGFIRRVMEENSDPESTFLTRLNNSDYTRFAKALPVTDGVVSVSASTLSEIADSFETASFRAAVGDVDENMRLSLNFQVKIKQIVSSGSSESAMVYKLLGNVPVRSVLDSALNLPTGFSKLDIDKQAEIYTSKLQSVFRISSVADLATDEMTEKVIQRFHAMEAIREGAAAYSPASTALTILQAADGFGASASENLFLSRL